MQPYQRITLPAQCGGFEAYGDSGKAQLIGVNPRLSRNALAWLKCLHPKNPV
jgi:hypothetical protein